MRLGDGMVQYYCKALYGLDGAILGHVGDGNYHAAFPVGHTDEAELETAEKVDAEIVAYALTRGGTCTGSTG